MREDITRDDIERTEYMARYNEEGVPSKKYQIEITKYIDRRWHGVDGVPGQCLVRSDSSFPNPCQGVFSSNWTGCRAQPKVRVRVQVMMD